MNKQIKDILEKHVDLKFIGNGTFAENINNAIIEICEEQKKEIAYRLQLKGGAGTTTLLNTKNISK